MNIKSNCGTLFLYCLGRCSGGCKGCQASTSVTREEAIKAIENLKKFLELHEDMTFVTVALETGGLLESSSLPDILENAETFKKLFKATTFININIPFINDERELKTIETLLPLLCKEKNVVTITHPMPYHQDNDSFDKEFVTKYMHYLELTQQYRNIGYNIYSVPTLLYNKTSPASMREFIHKNIRTEKFNIIDAAGTGFINSIFTERVPISEQIKIVKEFLDTYALDDPPSGNPHIQTWEHGKPYRTNLVINSEGCWKSVGTQYSIGSYFSILKDKNYCEEKYDLNDHEPLVNKYMPDECKSCKNLEECKEFEYVIANGLIPGDCIIKTYIGSFTYHDKDYEVLMEDEIYELISLYFTNEGMEKIMKMPLFKIAVIRDILTNYSPIYNSFQGSFLTDHIFTREEVQYQVTPKILKLIYKLYFKRPYLFKNFLKIDRTDSGYYGRENVK